MFVNHRILEEGRAENSLYAFFHAQRTGGSTFLRWLNETFPKEQIFSRPTTGAPYAHWHKIDAARLDGFRVFGGFSQYRDKEDLQRPLVCLSLTRHPFHRIVSVYEMSRRDKLHYRHEQALRTSFEQYYREVDEQEPSYFRDLMCRRICNAPDADAAMDMMARRFGVVGTTGRLNAMTELLARTYGWSAAPVKPVVPDEIRYKDYEKSAVFDDIMEKSAQDWKLYTYVRDYEVSATASGAAPPAAIPEIVSAPKVTCSVCGAGLDSPGAKGECQACNSPARTRSLRAVLETAVAPSLAQSADAALPLLAFAATGWERKLLAPHFPELQSVSLFGNYGSNHTGGVDVRDLSRYPDNSFSGAFGILLFDYFPEHEKALAELSRVIAPGGVLFTLVLPARVKQDDSAPVVTRRIEKRPGYFDYVPDDTPLLNVTVGRDWLVAAMERAGFAARHLAIPDPATDEISQWFVGVKSVGVAEPEEIDVPDDIAPVPDTPPPVAAASPAAARPRSPFAPKPAGPKIAAPALTAQTRLTQGFSQEFVCPLEGIAGVKEISLRLTIPAVPMAARRCDFAEHRWLANENRSSREVTCVGPGMLMISGDAGTSWDMVELPELAGQTPVNHFTTEAGTRLVQLLGRLESREERPPEEWGAIFRLNADFSVTDRSRNSGARWHGPRAIGQHGSTILYSDYFDNPGTAVLVPGTPEWDAKLHTCHVWKSQDDGRSWRSVFAKPPTEIRHFHFVMPDPYAPGTWWLSSGDKPRECRCWRSDDDGESWTEVTNREADVLLHPMAQRSRQAVFRATDMVILPDTLLWGTDDILVFNDQYKIVMNDPEKLEGYPRMGSRLFAAAKEDILKPVDCGVGGHPFRNLVDVGPGYVAFTEAKYAPIGKQPCVYFIDKQAPHRMQFLFTIPCTRGTGTGFSYSRASRAAVDGRFFSFRGAGDLANLMPRLLQWDVAFS